MICVELSHNHCGDLVLLKEMIATAAGCGAAAVKIQTHFADDLSDEWADKREHVKNYELDEKAHEAFFRWCQEYKVLPVTSVYTDKYSEMLKAIGFTTLKLGSAEASKTALAKKLILRGFDLWISTGAAALEKLEIPYRTHLIYHAISKYPHSPDEAGLLRMLRIKTLHPESEVGFSSHVDPLHRDWSIPIEIALILGAYMVEVHFTLLPREKTKDGKVSLSSAQLKQICDFDKLPEEKKWAQYELGMWISKQSPEESALIAHYTGRWRE